MDGRQGRKPRSLTRQLTWSIIGIIVVFAVMGGALSFAGGYREASRLQDSHLFSAMRQVAIGLVAAAFTFCAGRILGVSIS